MRVSRSIAKLIAISLSVLIIGPRVFTDDHRAVPVRHREGLVHGFLTLSTLGGTKIADGDLIQNAAGDRVTSRLVFHFTDGSLHDETVVYAQRETFQLVSDHLVQRGASFPQQVEMSIDRARQRVKVQYADEGKTKQETEQMDLPVDISNGMILTLLKNIPAGGSAAMSMVAATPKPRVVTLHVASAGQQTFRTGGRSRRATHYVVKVDIGGIAGFFAPIVGKQPPDSHVWILGGEAPAFVKSEQPLYAGGPIWRIELASPVW
ncbi:MAG TPA: hypothetical protein VJP86_12595 [Vicinamibacterales bacterium]|nr:hypothetical protein [Vicinamibacterales bacterium]